MVHCCASQQTFPNSTPNAQHSYQNLHRSKAHVRRRKHTRMTSGMTRPLATAVSSSGSTVLAVDMS